MRVAGAVFQVVHIAAKLQQAVERPAWQGGGQHGRKQRGKQAGLVLRGKAAQLRQALVADAALGRADRAQERRVVVRIDPQPEPGAQVLDFSAVKKAGAARDLVRNAGAAQRFFKRLGHVVGAVQDGKAAPFGRRVAGRAQALDAGDGAVGLVLFAVAIDHAHRLALAQLAEQRFGEQLGVRANHVVGGAQDGAGGAVVLLQLDHLQRGKVQRQLFQVVQRGAAPAVNALVVVAHGGEMAAFAHQQFEQVVLRSVGVLVFVHQHMAEQVLPLGAHLREVAQKLERQADQVVKVHALVGGQALFVARHDHGNAALVVVLGLGQRLLGVHPHVLPQADGPLPLARGGSIGGAAGRVFQDAGDVVGVQNAELGFEAQRLAVLPHHAHAERVEGANQHVLRRAPDQLLGALAHLGGRLVGEGDGGNRLGVHATLDQVSDLVRDDARLARAGTGQHQARPVGVVDSLKLGEVETG